MKYLKVNMWGREVGRLVWDSATRRAYFMYSPDPGTDVPDIAPLLSPAERRNVRVPIYGDDRPLYQGLPPFIADSLPDSWGNTLFDKWVRDNKIPRNKVTPLYKLMFIGTRGIGALEYEPCASDLIHSRTVDIKSLYDMSLKILEGRENVAFNINDELTLQSLLAVGTSAGGRQMKAIVAINHATGEIRSGQTCDIGGFEHYIIKFGDSAMPLAEIETAYYKMAVDGGIDMEECRLLPVGGVNHFLTKRFDRKDGKKIHVQTLSALDPESRSYDDLIATGRLLSISEREINQIFARLVFNVIANNTDDHTKNFSFLLEENGSWRLAPAYDLTFIFNTLGTGPNYDHRLSVSGKTSEISKKDLLDFAMRNEIRDANLIIDRVAGAIKNFSIHADNCGIPQPWRSIIKKTLDSNLARYGYIDENLPSDLTFEDSNGRHITKLGISVNSKGYLDVTVEIDGVRHRGFIRPNMALYHDLMQYDIFNLPAEEKVKVVETLFR